MTQWTVTQTRRLDDARRSVSWVQALSREHDVRADDIIQAHDAWALRLDAKAFEQHVFEPCELCVKTVQTIAEIEGENHGWR